LIFQSVPSQCDRARFGSGIVEDRATAVVAPPRLTCPDLQTNIIEANMARHLTNAEVKAGF